MEYDDEYMEEENPEEEMLEEEADFNVFLREQLKATPWWIISFMVHAIILCLTVLIVIEKPPAEVKIQFEASLEQEKVEEMKIEKKRDVFKKTKEVKPEEPMIEDPVVKEAKVSDHTETANNEEFKMAKGNEEAMSDSPFEGKFDNSEIGVGGGAGGAFGGRFGGKEELVKKGGGSKATESAVRAGLLWLKRHQSENGGWDADDFELNCGKDPEYPGSCDGKGSSWVDPGLTGLALLCFLGAGNTSSIGEFKDVVKKSIEYLIEIQTEDGCFGGKSGHYMYNHAIASLAMAEAYAGSNYNPMLKEKVQRAIDFLVGAQDKPGLKAWRYSYQSSDNDTSVTGWCVMALKSAVLAGINVPLTSFQGAKEFIDSVTDDAYYRTGYMQKGDRGARPQGALNFAATESITAVAMTSRVFIGADRRDAKLLGGAGLLSENLPVWGNDASGKSLIDFYYWYYGTLAMYQLGDEYWKIWNDKMKTALVDNQIRGGCKDGSWDPVDPWGAQGSRIYSTALNVLSLEIYYRYGKVFVGK